MARRGLSLYDARDVHRMNAIRGARHDGKGLDGEADCEHVAFHRDVKRLHNATLRVAPWIYCQGDPGPTASGYFNETIVRKESLAIGAGSVTTRKVPIANSAPAKWKLIHARDWKPWLTSAHPCNEMTPKLDVLWNRGFYNIALPHKKRPITYYNAKGTVARPLSRVDFNNYFTPNQCGIIWVRLWDLREWVAKILPNTRCGNGNITIITTDEDWDVPRALPHEIPEKIFRSEQIKAWYSTNVVAQDHTKLFPVPIGLPIQRGFPGSPDSEFTIKAMDKLRLSAKPFAERNRSILYDVGTLGVSARRDKGRKAARMALEKCPDGRIRIMPKGGSLEIWPLHASHQFAIAPVGVGYDTHFAFGNTFSLARFLLYFHRHWTPCT